MYTKIPCEKLVSIHLFPDVYVIRESVEIPDGDPGFALSTIDDEMIRRAPHTTDSFHVDSATVWNVVRHVTLVGHGCLCTIVHRMAAMHSLLREATIRAMPIATT